MKRVLVTGASGFLGKIVVNELIENCEIITLSRSSGNHIISLEERVPLFDEKFDLVIHTAGKAHSFSNGLEDRDEFYRVNVQGTSNLLEGLANCKLPNSFVFISTVAVYGLSSGYLISEQSELRALDPYGKSKIKAEQLVFQWCKVNDVKCTILRLPLVVGLNPPGNLGSMIYNLKRGFYFNIADGRARKSMVLAIDVAKCILKVSEIGGLFNLTDGYHPSFFELSKNISQQLGKSRVRSMPFWLAKGLARIGDFFGDKAPLNSAKLHKMISHLTFDDSKAREVFGWSPTPVLEGYYIIENIK